jgi:hypothetical protein
VAASLKFSFPVLFLVLTLTFTVCHEPQKTKKNSPAAVSDRFFSLLMKQEFDKAKKLATEKTVRLVRAVQTLTEWGNGINLLRDNKKELVGCEIKGDTAICTYKAYSGPDEKVLLVKQKGKWLVDLMDLK